jgi:hypothetical protein
MHKKCNSYVLSNLNVILNGEACEIYAIRVPGKYIFTTTVKHHKFLEQMARTRFQALTAQLMAVWGCDTVILSFHASGQLQLALFCTFVKFYYAL